jgi:hypothetical protein
MKAKAALLLILLAPALFAAGNVLIVADEFPAMETLARKLKAAEGLESRIVKQTELPASLGDYSAVIVYIHMGLDEPAEKALVQYAEAGGRLVLLHHSISSGKRTNRYWFPFLGIELPAKPYPEGGYKYYEGIEMDVVNLAPGHFITSRKIEWPKQAAWEGRPHPAVALDETEVYLNHVLTGARTTLLGIEFTDKTLGRSYAQASGGWYKPAGKGWVFYFMPGHSAHEFENPVYSQIVANALVFQPN